MVVAFRSDNVLLATADANGLVVCWDKDGLVAGKVQAHKGPVMALTWQPLHLNVDPLLASAGKDGMVKIMSFPTASTLLTFQAHKMPVTKLIWGGEDRIFSCSEDQTIKAWNKNGRLHMEYAKHAHWVNSIALSNEHLIRGGGFDHAHTSFPDKASMREHAIELYRRNAEGAKERLVSASDDHTLQLFETGSAQPVARLVGHQQPVNHVQFSPNGQFVVSCSFDKSLRLWSGYTGEFMATLRGHVGAIYMVSWSPDSRYVVSGSRDSTMKVWDIRTRKLMFDLPGHADEVYALDWSRDGTRVASGGKDRQVKIWSN
jgi:ribosome assembly protein 4